MIGFEPFLFLFTIGALYCWLGARPGAMVMQWFARIQGWGGDVDLKKARRIAFWALMAHLAVSACMDFITGTSQSLLLLVPTIDTPQCAPNCYIFGEQNRVFAVRSVGTYYATVVGPGLANWLMYVVWQMPGIVAAFFVIVNSSWQPRGRVGLGGMFAASAISVGIGLAVLVPLFITLLLALIEGAQ